MNDKGFTLVELLVCIAIIGIVLSLAIPNILNLKNKNKNTEYEYYEKTVLNALKLYAESSDNTWSGCRSVDINTLVEARLLTRYISDGVTCQERLYIEKRDINAKREYIVYINCSNESGLIYESDTIENIPVECIN